MSLNYLLNMERKNEKVTHDYIVTYNYFIIDMSWVEKQEIVMS